MTATVPHHAPHLARETFLENPLGTAVGIADVLDDFEFLSDWEDRYAYIIDLGRKLPSYPEEARDEAHKVHGCQSQVWLVHYFDPASGQLYLLLDSDAMIVRGLAALVLIALNARTPQELLSVDIDDLFQKLDLFRHMSPTRGNGLRAMVGRIQELARQY
ncbi:MAG: SufE family protein [Gammaproteobacteria bacterium]|nr:SufE family protein [Gammaproteobacteria bacterium]